MKGPKPRPLSDRFWAKVKKGPKCWEWTGYINIYGYGTLYDNAKKRPFVAHIISYRLNNGPIPDGMCVMHKCDNRRCVRPDHLSIGTLADNNHDMARKGRASKGEAHHWAKISEIDARAILERLVNGERQRYIARDYGITSPMVSMIGRGHAWRHIAYVRTEERVFNGCCIKVSVSYKPDKNTNPVDLKNAANVCIDELFQAAAKRLA